MITLGTSSASSVTTASYFRTNDTVFELKSDIGEYIATEDKLDINYGGGKIYVEGCEFEFHMNANGNE